MAFSFSARGRFARGTRETSLNFRSVLTRAGAGVIAGAVGDRAIYRCPLLKRRYHRNSIAPFESDTRERGGEGGGRQGRRTIRDIINTHTMRLNAIRPVQRGAYQRVSGSDRSHALSITLQLHRERRRRRQGQEEEESVRKIALEFHR